jgi:2'-5' RNA ligase
MRLFFAVELPAEVRSALGQLRPASAGPEYRWSDSSLLHVTLAFLGEQPEEALPGLERIGAEAASASTASTLRLGQPGFFGSRAAPRVLWLGLDGDLGALQALQTRLDRGLREAGFQLEERPFSPHITLARRRDRAAGRAATPWPPAIVTHLEFPLHQLTLFQSKLSSRGPSYIPLAQAALSGSSS